MRQPLAGSDSKAIGRLIGVVVLVVLGANRLTAGEADELRANACVLTYDPLPLPSPFTPLEISLWQTKQGVQLGMNSEFPVGNPVAATLESLHMRVRMHRMAESEAPAWTALALEETLLAGSHFGGEPVKADTTTTFPFGSNDFSWGWVELAVGDNTWWLEIPPGLLRNPSDPLCAPRAHPDVWNPGPPSRPFGPHDTIVHWRTASLGQCQLPSATIALTVAQHYDGGASLARITIRPLEPATDPFRVHDHVTSVTIMSDGHAFGTAEEVAIQRIGAYRDDTFDCGSIQCVGSCFYTVVVTMDAQRRTWIVPSTFINYDAGHFRGSDWKQLSPAEMRWKDAFLLSKW